jgi:hypothetical protein
MAGKIQKPYESLQYKRGGRRRPKVLLFPMPPLSSAQRDAAINAAIGGLERAFGRKSRDTSASAPPEKRKRRYRPRAEQRTCPAKAKIAQERPRDAKGHFLSGKRRRPETLSSDLETALAAVAVDDLEAALAAAAPAEAEDCS